MAAIQEADLQFMINWVLFVKYRYKVGPAIAASDS